jgi:hypothetical protein
MMKFIKCFLIISMMVTSLAAVEVKSSSPDSFNFSGILTDVQGNRLIGNHAFDLAVDLFDVESGGVSVYHQDYTNVMTKDGVFSIIVGPGLDQINTAEHVQWYQLSIKEAGSSEAPTAMGTRQKIRVHGFSYFSHFAERADISESAQYANEAQYLGGLMASDFAQVSQLDTLQTQLIDSQAKMHESTQMLALALASVISQIETSFAALQSQAGGSAGNTVSGTGSLAYGGAGNTADGLSEGFTSVGGGQLNTAVGGWSFIGGGSANFISGAVATIAGGQENKVIGAGSVVSGGAFNEVTGAASFIGGGSENWLEADYAVLGGGQANMVNAIYGIVAGGAQNIVRLGAAGSTISGGASNMIDLGSAGSVISGGEINYINGSYNVIPGGQNTSIIASNSFAFSGGQTATINSSNVAVFMDVDFGIGLVDPEARLDIIGDGSKPALIIETSDQATKASLFVSSMGKVGVSTEIPQALLDVNGDVRADTVKINDLMKLEMKNTLPACDANGLGSIVFYDGGQGVAGFCGCVMQSMSPMWMEVGSSGLSCP